MGLTFAINETQADVRLDSAYRRANLEEAPATPDQNKGAKDNSHRPLRKHSAFLGLTAEEHNSRDPSVQRRLCWAKLTICRCCAFLYHTI